MGLMMMVLLIAGIGSVLAGVLAIAFGIPVKEFSFGNTLILVGVVAACSGMILLGLWLVVRELKNIARRLGAGTSAESRMRSPVPVGPGGFLFNRDEDAENSDHHELAPIAPPSPAPWQDQAGSRDRVRADGPPDAEPVGPTPEPAAKPRRNLLFSSTSRKERERAAARAAEPPAPDVGSAPPVVPPGTEADEAPPATFDDAWPKSGRARGAELPPQRRSDQAPSTVADTSAPAHGDHEQPPVTVLKSGVVDGMAYSLYSDGSIEAQMPEGMMRFASIEELRSHLDQRP